MDAFEVAFALVVLFDGVYTLVQQAMVFAAQQNAVVETGFAAVRPMHHVMRVEPARMAATRIAAVFVAGKESTFQLWRHDALLAAEFQRIALDVFGDFGKRMSVSMNEIGQGETGRLFPARQEPIWMWSEPLLFGRFSR